ncbi:MAG TPA: glycosyltransferase family 4 protein [Nitrososphaerales archaeon]|nr:glycosyltransferase family 4 protein [Nitrososphaerales archaeon]
MKIAFCHYYSLSFGGGGERFVVESSDWLTKKGHAVSIHSVPFRRGNWRPTSKTLTYSEAPIHFFDADVVYHIYNPLVGRLFRCDGPRIAGIHSSLLTRGLAEEGYSSGSFTQNTRNHGLAAAFMKVLAKRVQAKEIATFDAVHWISPAPPTELSHRRLFQIPNWVNTKVFRPGTKANQFIVLFVGKHSYGKGFDRFVQVSEIMSDIKFVCTGERVGRIEGTGQLNGESLANLYSQSSVVMLPSRADAFSLTLIESLACGTPVITTPIPAHLSVDIPAFYAGDIPELVRELKHVYSLWKSERQEYERIANLGVRSTRRYEMEVVLPRFEAMLREVADDHVKRD